MSGQKGALQGLKGNSALKLFKSQSVNSDFSQ